MHDRVIGDVGIEAGSGAIDVDVQMGAQDRPRIDKSVADPGDLLVKTVDHAGNSRPRHRKPPRRSGEERDE